MPTLAVIVPATDAPATLERCVDAIRAADDPPDEVVVVDRPANSGPAAARNEGATRVAAAADILVFVDADVLVHRDAFRRIRAAFAADPRLTAIFGSYDDVPPVDDAVSTFRNLLHHHVHQSAAGPATTFWAGLGAVRRSDFVEVGGFDARRFPRPSIEDIELGMRLVEAGKHIVLDPALQGTHLKRWTLGDMIRVDLCRRGIPWVALLLRTGSASTTLNLGWRHRLSAAATGVAFAGIARRRTGHALAGLAALVTLNQGLYALVARRRGPAAGVASVGLHAVHHLAGILSVPAGAAVYVAERLRDRRR